MLFRLGLKKLLRDDRTAWVCMQTRQFAVPTKMTCAAGNDLSFSGSSMEEYLSTSPGCVSCVSATRLLLRVSLRLVSIRRVSAPFFLKGRLRVAQAVPAPGAQPPILLSSAAPRMGSWLGDGAALEAVLEAMVRGALRALEPRAPAE